MKMGTIEREEETIKFHVEEGETAPPIPDPQILQYGVEDTPDVYWTLILSVQVGQKTEKV